MNRLFRPLLQRLPLGSQSFDSTKQIKIVTMESKNTNLPLSSKVANPRIYKKLHVNKILKICAIITLYRFFVMSTFPGSWDG